MYGRTRTSVASFSPRNGHIRAQLPHHVSHLARLYSHLFGSPGWLQTNAAVTGIPTTTTRSARLLLLHQEESIQQKYI